MTREEATQIIENMPISHECMEFFGLALEALRQPEIIRCKDCKFGKETCGNIKCHKPGMREYESDYHSFDWFCADGERRTE